MTVSGNEKLPQASTATTVTGLKHQVWRDRLYFGDNLAVLRSLLKDNSVKGQVKLVYIDPPFGTGQDFIVSNSRYATISRPTEGCFAYGDRLMGQEYLDSMRSRLEVIRDLLADDGSIYVHIDYKMGHYVKVLLDDVFGADKFKSDITRIKCNPKNFSHTSYPNIKDTILFYSKNGSHIWNPPRAQYQENELVRRFPRIDADGRRYTTTPLHAPGETRNGLSGSAWKGIKPPVGRHWRNTPAVLTDLDNKGLIEWSSNGNPRKKLFADEVKGKLVQDVWVFKDPAYPVYPTEKNLKMLEMIIGASSNAGNLVMDCFCGSGGTLVAASNLGRRWIGIDNSQIAMTICERRTGIKPITMESFDDMG